MALPLILAGPILRRVEPRLVTVWLALSESADVTLSVWQGIANAGSGPGLFSGPAPNFTSDSFSAARVCEHLHIAVVTLDIPAPDVLLPAHTFSYNVTISSSSGTHDLKSEGLLQDDTIGGHLHAALGYGPGDLPSFAMPPPELTELRVVHYSCRRPHERGPDALAFVDDLIDDNVQVASQRPHLLFMTGDQIYADDVSPSLLPIVTDLGRQLMGSIREEVIGTTGPIEVGQATLPARFRDEFIKEQAGFTSGTSSHLLSFGEFAAMYLTVWNNRFWPTPEPDGSFPVTKFQVFEDLLDRISPASDELIPTWKELFRPPDSLGLGTDLELFVKHMFVTLPSATLLRFFDGTDKQFDPDTIADDVIDRVDDDERKRFETTYAFAGALSSERRKKFQRFVKYLQGRFHRVQDKIEVDLDHMQLMYQSLPKVRRVLANVPCYMMWDDHDVTDDWNLTRGWRDGVLTKDSGVTVLRNGMLAGALFQLWGNDPKAYVPNPAGPNHPDSLRAEFLEQVKLLYPQGATAPPQAAAGRLNVLFGLDGAETPPLRWHFRVDGPLFRTLVLDTRTRRSFRGPDTPPLLLSESALEDQIPDEDLPSGFEVLIVVSPVPVLGPPVDEEIARPVAARVTDYKAARENKRPSGHVKMDIEWWSADSVMFAELLARLERYKRVLFLSGDVHHGLGATLDYWKEGEPEPARFVQFTSSPAKNILPEALAVSVAGAFAFSQRIIRLGVPLERMKWDEPSPAPVTVAAGQVPRPALRAALRRKPVLVPTHAWPPGTSETRPADARWRLHVLSDDRADDKRPSSVQPAPLPADFGDLEALEQYKALLDRHLNYVQKNNFGRVFVFSNNVGLVRFARDGGVLEARHEFISVHPDQAPAGKPLTYTIHRASVEPTTDDPPELS